MTRPKKRVENSGRRRRRRRAREGRGRGEGKGAKLATGRVLWTFQCSNDKGIKGIDGHVLGIVAPQCTTSFVSYAVALLSNETINGSQFK